MSIPRARLRWSVILAACVLLSIGLLRLKERVRFYRHQLANLTENERMYAERWPIAGPEERAWLEGAAAYDARNKAEYEWEARSPWRSMPSKSAMIWAGD